MSPPEIHRRPDLQPDEFFGIVTTSQRMRDLFRLVERVARTDASVLIRGETGTGKELIARALHALSPRRDAPLKALNCATLTPELLASELFGHVRGAFTGAIRDRRGLFSLADGGTMFLDELAELPLDLQARLLRVLQEKTFVPVGGTDPVTVDVRMVSATHEALRQAVMDGLFREDLMYRIRVVPLYLPPLRERGGDIEALIWHFIEVFNRQGYRRVVGISAAVMDALRSYDWPGNVRELRNTVEYAYAVGEGEIFTADELTPELLGEGPVGVPRRLTAADLERQRLLEALEEAKGKKAAAAELLGMSRSTLWRKLREHRI